MNGDILWWRGVIIRSVRKKMNEREVMENNRSKMTQYDIEIDYILSEFWDRLWRRVGKTRMYQQNFHSSITNLALFLTTVLFPSFLPPLPFPFPCSICTGGGYLDSGTDGTTFTRLLPRNGTKILQTAVHKTAET